MTLLAVALVASDLFLAIRAQDLAQVEKVLAQDRALASSRDENGTSPVSAALGSRKGEAFVPRRENRILDAILRCDPELSPFEVAAVGTAAQLRMEIRRSPDYVRSVSRNGWTPLHYAAFANNLEAVVALLHAGAAIDARAKNKFDNTPLQVSLLTSSREAAAVLLVSGADVNARQAEGVTALHEAAAAGEVEIIRMLLALGADPSVASAKFGTPRDMAIKNKHPEAAQLLAR